MQFKPNTVIQNFLVDIQLDLLILLKNRIAKVCLGGTGHMLKAQGPIRVKC